MPSNSQESGSDDEYLQWKENIPLLYDSFFNHNLEWPCSSLAWGPIVTDLKKVTKQNIFISQSTDATYEQPSNMWRGCPNTIELKTASITHPSSVVYSNLNDFDEEDENPKLIHDKRIIHPGEITKMKSCITDPFILISATTGPDIYVWDIKKAEDRAKFVNQASNDPLLTLKGHNKNAPYALDVSNMCKRVVSGGEDKKILIWDLDGRILKKQNNPDCPSEMNSEIALLGHTGEVLDVAFSPSNDSILGSASSDKSVRIWDYRQSKALVLTVENLHSDDVNSISFNQYSPNIISTCGSDNVVKVTDLRLPFESNENSKNRNNASINIFEDQLTDNAISVSWNSTQTDFFLVGDESGKVSIINYEKKKKIFEHCGHRSPVETIEWNPYFSHRNHLEWTIASSSNDAAQGLGGGTLQIWRPLDLIYKDEHDFILEFKKYSKFMEVK